MTEFSEDFDNTSVPLEHVLRCSLEKIHSSRRCRSGANLRKNLMIANIIFKTRNEILEYRTRVFMERNRQLPGIKGRHAYYPSVTAADCCMDDARGQSTPMAVESRSEEVLEECLVQEDLLLDEEEDEDIDDAFKEDEEEVEVCVEIEKENNPPSTAAAITLMTPLTLDLPGESHSYYSNRKRRSADEETLNLSSGGGGGGTMPCKRATPETSPEVVVPAVGSSTMCSLTENFQKSISFQLPCGLTAEQTSNGLASAELLDSQSLLVQFSSLTQQLAVAAS